MPLTPAVFAIDAIDGYFHGHTEGQRWNGFACPLFSLEEGKRLAVVNNATDYCGRLEYDEKSDSFLHHNYENAAEEPLAYPAVVIEGEKFYPIGAHGWTWYVVADDSVAEFSSALFVELRAMRNAGMRVPDRAFMLAANRAEVEDVMNMKASEAADLLIQLADAA